MDMNRMMILFAGCFLILFSKFRWKINHVIWNKKYIKAFAIILGCYNIILAICLRQDLIVFFLLDYIFYLALDLSFLLIRIRRDRKGLIKAIHLGVYIILVLISVLIVILDRNEVYSSVSILSGAMMVISVSFSDVREVKYAQCGKKAK